MQEGHTEKRLLIETLDGGHNSGRPYIHKMPDDDALVWVSLMRPLIKEAVVR